MRDTWSKYKQIVLEWSGGLSETLVRETLLLRWLVSILRRGRRGNVCGLSLLGRRFGYMLVHWWIENLDGVWERLLWASLAFGVPTLHDLNFDAKHTLPEHDVPDSVVYEINSRLTGMDHETVGKLHGLRTGGTKLSGDDNFAAFGVRFHNKAEDTVTSPADRETVEEFIPQTLALGNSRKAAVLDLLSVHLKGVFGEAETLLNESGQFTDPAALFTQDFLSMSCTNNNLGTSVGHSDIATRVSLLGKFAGKEIIELSAEDTIGDEFSPLADLGRHFGED